MGTLAVPWVMVIEEGLSMNRHAYVGERKLTPTIASTRIGSTVTAMSLNL